MSVDYSLTCIRKAQGTDYKYKSKQHGFNACKIDAKT